MQQAIYLDGVVKRFARGWRSTPVEVLSQVSFSVDQGEAFGFIGPNGAGKSTTIKILIGVLNRDAGTAQMLGYDVGDERARRGVGYVPESPYLYDYLTPLEILEMGLALHGVRVDQPRQHCMAWLERFQVAHVANKSIRNFSKGMVQRTALAHAMAICPKLLILDEPLSGLDPIGRREVVEILAEYRQQGGTLFFTSHVLHDVERLADHYGLIHQGRLTTVRSPAEFSSAEDSVVVRTIGDSPLPGMLTEGAGRYVVELPRSQLWPLLDAIRGAGHRLVEIRPTLSLESAFMKFVGEAPQDPVAENTAEPSVKGA